MNYHENILSTIGNTPLVKINRIANGQIGGAGVRAGMIESVYVFFFCSIAEQRPEFGGFSLFHI